MEAGTKVGGHKRRTGIKKTVFLSTSFHFCLQIEHDVENDQLFSNQYRRKRFC